VLSIAGLTGSSEFSNRPKPRPSLRAEANVGFLRSASINSTLLPRFASDLAMAKAEVDLPSPARVEVISRVFGSPPGRENLSAVRTAW